MSLSKLDYSSVNSNPLRFFKKNPSKSSSGGASGGASGRASSGAIWKYVFFDFSGSMNEYSMRQLVNLFNSLEKIMIFPFGGTISSGYTGRSPSTWRYWLERNANKWIDLNILMTVWNDNFNKRTDWGTLPTMFVWATHTDLIDIGLQTLPTTGSTIDVIFVGDGAFSDRNFISHVSKAARNGSLKNVSSFTFLGANNISPGTKITLDRELKRILTTSSSAIKWNSSTLLHGPDELTNKITAIKSSGIVIPPGWLFFDAGSAPQLFHEKLTPMSISKILIAHGGLVCDYIDYLVRVFRDTPIMFTREDNIASKIYQGLKILKAFNNDEFNIKKCLFDRISKANTTPSHKAAFKILSTADSSAEKLFIEQMRDRFTGEFYRIVTDSGGAAFSPTQIDAAMRDMSYTTFIRLLDNSFCEASTDTIIKTTDFGFPVIAESSDWESNAIMSMRMIPFLLGQEGRLIGGNFKMVSAMYLLTSEYMDEPYIRRVAEAFIFSAANRPTIRDLIYTATGEFQDNIYSTAFARVIFHFCQIYSDRIGDLGIDFDAIKNIYVAICKISSGRSFTHNITITKEAYEFEVGDIVLISPDSWLATGGVCPYPEMVNLARITDPNPKERNFRKGSYRLRFLEGDSMDFTYVDASFMVKLAGKDELDAGVIKTIRKFQRDMWLKWLHFPDRREDSDDGKETNRDGSLITFKQNLHAIMRMIDPRHSLEVTAKKLITMKLEAPKNIIGTLTGIPMSGKITKTLIEATRASLGVSPDIMGFISTTPVDELTIKDEYGIFSHIIDESDIADMVERFNLLVSAKSAGYECACGCEAIIRPGVIFESPGCGHHYIPRCLKVYKDSCIQDPMNITFGVSECPIGCQSCISPLIRLNDHTVIITSNMDDSLVNSSATNIIGRCVSCYDYFVRGPRDCSLTHTLPTQCTECLPKQFWQCPGTRSDGTRCSVMTEHGGGCRMMQCCPIRNGWDDPCPDGCTHTQKVDGHVIAIGCGARYKMEDGLKQDDGTAVSDGSHFY